MKKCKMKGCKTLTDKTRCEPCRLIWNAAQNEDYHARAAEIVTARRPSTVVLLVIGGECVTPDTRAAALRAIDPAASWTMAGNAHPVARAAGMRRLPPHRVLAFGPLWTGDRMTPTGGHVAALLHGGFPVRWIAGTGAAGVDLAHMPESLAARSAA